MVIASDGLPKTSTGIPGLDDITGGGLPQGRTTLVCGGTGVGKTLLALEFLVHGAALCDEPGVFFTFEESADELRANVGSLGFDLSGMIAYGKLDIDHVCLERSPVGGVYDLDGLFIRLDSALKKVGAKRVVLDSIDMLFMALPNPVMIREEIRRLLRWLKAKDVTVIITGECVTGGLTRDGMEEYVADCVILLENRVFQQTMTRLLRIVKYRGSVHGTNEYPFLISNEGISVLPVTTLRLDLPASSERISTGVPQLDAMLGGQGYYRDSTIMVSGPPGSGKSSIAAKFAHACCARGERCIYFLLEESTHQIVRNMRSIGIDLQVYIDNGLLQVITTRPTLHGMEMHLSLFHQAIVAFKPRAVIFDPISTLHNIEDVASMKSMVLRLVNFLKAQQITGHFVSLTEQGITTPVELGLSSLIDSWVQVRNVESNGERNRVLVVLKSRGMAHSNQMREFLMSGDGIELVDMYIGQAGVLTGSARVAQQAEEKLAELTHRQRIEYHTQELERKRQVKNAQIAALEAAFASNELDLMRMTEVERQRQRHAEESSGKMQRSRQSGFTDHAEIIPVRVAGSNDNDDDDDDDNSHGNNSGNAI